MEAAETRASVNAAEQCGTGIRRCVLLLTETREFSNFRGPIAAMAFL
jgi:hypothetical protein